jgi:hypothetical protein
MPEMVVDASKLPYNEHALASDLASALAQAAPRQFTIYQTLPYQILSPISLAVSNNPRVRFSAACYIGILPCPHIANYSRCHRYTALNLNPALSITSQADHMLFPKTQVILS